MLTLFRSISGGDWGELSQVLADVGGLYILLWVVYISFTVFGLLNILTGIFVDIAMKKAESDHSIARIEQTHKEQEFKRVI